MPARKKKIFDHFKHSTKLHQQKEVTALNNKYPGLKGYGVYCYLMELCGSPLDGRIPFSRNIQQQLADAMNVDVEDFREIVSYLDNVSKLVTISKVQGMLFLSIEELNRQAAKENAKRQAARNNMAEKRAKLKKKGGVRVDVRESESKKRRRIFNEFDEILIFTDRINTDASLKYPHLGSIRVYFEIWKRFIKMNHRDYWGKITHENYVVMFYMNLNQYEEPLLEALVEDANPARNFTKVRKRPIKFNLNT